MIAITKYSLDGRIQQIMTLLNEAEADLNGPWILGHWDESQYYVFEGAAIKRPTTGLPETHTFDANADWLLPNVPQNTVVFVDGDEVGAVGADGLILSFEFPATYTVRLEPPFPWKPATCEVTVT